MVKDEVTAILVRCLGVDFDEIVPEASIREDLGADSLDIVDLALTCEQAFELEEIPEDDMKTIATVADLVKYISRKVEVAT